MSCPSCRCNCKPVVPVTIRVLRNILVVDTDGQALMREPGDLVKVNRHSQDFIVLLGNRQAEEVTPS